MTTRKNQARSQEILQVTGLKPTHFADLVRVAQLVYDPGGGVSGRVMQVDWTRFGMPLAVADNLRSLGHQYQYESPDVAVDLVWDALMPETRSWFMAHRRLLWRIEESFPALDED